ncbi:MAG: hypothetical protein IT190_00375 [Microbacteriaceae bacterium]|nr:hypothetical protein [Microbacteriaceae bacterium]
MNVPQQASSTAFRQAFLSSAMVVVSASLLLVGCVAGPGATSSGVDSTSAVPLGYEWTEIPFTGPLVPGTSHKAFSARGAVWLYDQTKAMNLYGTTDGTTDGKTWRTVDAAAAGFPAKDVEFRFDCESVNFGNVTSSTFWNQTQLFDSGWGFAAVNVDETGFAAYAGRSAEGGGWDSGQWHTVDGVPWTEVENSNPQPMLLSGATRHDGGLVRLLSDKFLMSGPPA